MSQENKIKYIYIQKIGLCGAARTAKEGGKKHFVAIFRAADNLVGGAMEVPDQRHFQLPLTDGRKKKKSAVTALM